MAEHEHGSMDYDAQEKTLTRSVVVILAILVLLALFAG